MVLPVVAGGFLGWALGANDAANCFGTAVRSGMLRFRTATLLCAVMVVVGALLEGHAGIETLGGLTSQTALTAGLTALSAAITVTVMTLLGLPISTSQAVVGAILGIGLMQRQLNLEGLEKVVVCWVGTPLGALLLAAALYPLLGRLYNRLDLGVYRQDEALRIGLIAVGCYGGYALGANNVANVSAVLVASGLSTPLEATLIGGGSIALGALTFSRRVMATVGSGVVKLDAFSALVVVLAEALTVHVYAWVGVPVSTSQAVVGAVVGVGLVRGLRSVRLRRLRNIALGWLLTPAIGAALSAALYFVTHLRYVG